VINQNGTNRSFQITLCGIVRVGDDRERHERRKDHAEAVADREGDDHREGGEHDDPAVTTRSPGRVVPTELGEDIVQRAHRSRWCSPLSSCTSGSSRRTGATTRRDRPTTAPPRWRSAPAASSRREPARLAGSPMPRRCSSSKMTITTTASIVKNHGKMCDANVRAEAHRGHPVTPTSAKTASEESDRQEREGERE
jgi:hypothetical protein